jgi:hypothetical protein
MIVNLPLLSIKKEYTFLAAANIDVLNNKKVNLNLLP